MAIGERSPYGVAFWLKSAVSGTGLLLAAGVITLAVIFAYSQIQADGFAWTVVGASLLAAVFWGILGLVGTCYFSIPIATLIVGGIRILCRELMQARRRRGRPAPVASAPSR